MSPEPTDPADEQWQAWVKRHPEELRVSWRPFIAGYESGYSAGFLFGYEQGLAAQRTTP